MRLFILSYVPVTRPSRATRMIKQFFVSTNLLGPFDVPHAKTNSITGGKINAKPDEQRAPINEMNEFRAGTSSAKESVKTKTKPHKYSISVVFNAQNQLFRQLTCDENQECSENEL